ncbi:hypothetical protein P7K49_022441 [Saguinus oedipus]|uniref:Uncharacterized protein n=1 Tax=Saguinus oedipus TaxID=9490 RepID=A0ABQ9UX79_SAGOE|nr:hypothetical protein P7K49_022441 [Saguinus oedipus]
MGQRLERLTLLAKRGVCLPVSPCADEVIPQLQWEELELRLGYLGICYGLEAGEHILISHEEYESHSGFVHQEDSFPTAAEGAGADVAPCDLLKDGGWRAQIHCLREVSVS